MVQSSNVYQVIQEQIARLRLAEQRFQQERLILERTLGELGALDEFRAVSEPTPVAVAQAAARPQVSVQRKRAKPGHNRPVIVSVLRDAGKPLRRSEIGHRAFEAGLIRSVKGRDGVISIVGTVLGRNEKNTFIHLPSGTWDLRERQARPENNGHVQEQPQLVEAR